MLCGMTRRGNPYDRTFSYEQKYESMDVRNQETLPSFPSYMFLGTGRAAGSQHLCGVIVCVGGVDPQPIFH